MKKKKKRGKRKMKTILGMPMNWDIKNAHKDIWNPKEKKVFAPRKFGIGWGVNLHAVIKKAKKLVN